MLAVAERYAQGIVWADDHKEDPVSYTHLQNIGSAEDAAFRFAAYVRDVRRNLSLIHIYGS